MHISRRESFLILILAVLVVIVLGARLLVLPAYDRFAARKAELMSLNVTGSDTAVRTDPDNGEDISIDSDAVAIFLPEANNESLHRYFKGFINSSGLELNSIIISQSDAGLPPGFSVAGINLSMTGTQEQAMRFIEGIEGTGRAIVIESMSMTPVEASKISMVITLNAYCTSKGTDTLDFVPEMPQNVDGFRFITGKAVT